MDECHISDHMPLVVNDLTPDHVQEAQELTLDCELSALSMTRAAHLCLFPV